MKEKILQIVAAIMLGIALPGLVIRLTTLTVRQSEPEKTDTTAPVEEAESQGIWVLTKDGQTQWMHLEEYLTGVLLAEMPTTYSHDALCAQAVAARTYALKRQSSDRHEQGAVCADPACCQAYVDIAEYLDGLGYAQDVEIARSAVNATAQMVITYSGELIEATYFHSSGGRTEEAIAVWGVDYPYLQTVESPGEEQLEDASKEVFFTREELENRLERTLVGTPESWIGWMTYTVGGGVEGMLLAGIQYSGIQLRSLLDLNSTMFTVRAEKDGLCFTTMGRGHRVGMSQTGAEAMALEGKTWQEILGHYYPGTRIDKFEEVG